ncbi:hypothetical protein FQN54_000742 [Arachnomyces sp. PD_36]|nr:hypothetical protein FQN54_000742 [Arachnomyces sp. PD_36]
MRSKSLVKKPRSRAKEGPAFIFVDTTDNLSAGLEGKDARIAIRSQAARSGRKRRRDESTGSENVDITHSVALVSLPKNAAIESHTTGDHCSMRDKESSPIPSPAYPIQLSYNGYETLRVKYNVDITHLTSFTDVDLGRTAYLSIRDQPTRLSSLLLKQSSSFLTYLPSRYGFTPYLDDAMHCVAARAGQMLGFPVPAPTLTTLYTKALHSLQVAIEDSEHCLGSDVYCATRLLTLFELIGLPDVNRWICHSRGGIKLIQLRGPQNHKSRFDRMLLKSQGPSIIVDEMFREQTSIFETPDWQSFFEHASSTETDVDTSLWWKFFGASCFMPGILKDLRILFKATLSQPEYLEQSSMILERANSMYKTLQDSHILYQHRPPHPPSLFLFPNSPESADRVRLRGFFLYITMYICRVQASLCPNELERARSEVEAQTFATQALLVEKMAAELDPAMTWHLEQRNALAHSIIETREDWFSVGTDGMSWVELRDFLAKRWLKWEDSWRDTVLNEELGERGVEF